MTNFIMAAKISSKAPALKSSLSRHPLIRQIYLYLFAILGLVLLTIGSVRLVNLGLKTFIFTKADQEASINYPFREPPYAVKPPPYDTQPPTENRSTYQLTPDEITALKQWNEDYQIYQEKEAKIDRLAGQRQREAADSLGLIIVGLPLYLYHWTIIKRETAMRESAKKA